MANLFLADIVKYLHVALFFVVILGWMLPIKWLPYYVLFIIVILLDWNDLDGMCILTKFEHWLRYDTWEVKSSLEGGPEFFRPMINNALGIELTRIQADRLNAFIFVLGLTLAFARLAFHYRMFSG